MDGIGPGSIVGNRFSVTRRLQFAPDHERWAATDFHLGRAVTLLVVASDGPLAADVLDAARRAAGIEDSRLVRIVDAHSDERLTWIVEDPLGEAQTLGELLRDGPLAAEDARRLIGETATALARAQTRGLHHLCLRPASIYSFPDGRVQLLGLATTAAAESAPTLDSPSASRVDARALVALLYAALTARWPQDAGLASMPLPDAASVGLEAAPLIDGSLADPSEFVTGIPEDLAELCLTLTGPDGPSDPADVARALGTWSIVPFGASAAGATTAVHPDVIAAAQADPGPIAGAFPGDTGGPTTPSATPAATAAATSAVLPDAAPGAIGDDTAELPAVIGGSRRRSFFSRRRDAGAGSVSPAAPTSAASPAAPTSAASPTVSGLPVAQTVPAETAAEGHPAADLPVVGDTATALEERLNSAPREPLAAPAPRVPAEIESPSGRATAVLLSVIFVLVLVAGYFAVRGLPVVADNPSGQPTTTRSTGGPSTGTTPSTAPSVPMAMDPIPIAGISVYNPSDNLDEGSSWAGRAIDGDLTTMWRSRWSGRADWAGRKNGVGLIADLGSPRDVGRIVLTLPQASQDLSIYITNSPTIAGSGPVQTVPNASGEVTISPGQSVKGQYVIVYITRMGLEQAPSQYRAMINEIKVLS